MADVPGRRLTPKQQRFVQEYLIDLNGAQAAIRAGYSERTANVQAAQLLAKLSIAEAVKERQAMLEVETGITQKWVLDKLKENVEKAMQATPVYDREGNETGEYTYAGAVANGALNLLGKHLGMFGDKLDLTSGGKAIRGFEPDIYGNGMPKVFS